MADGTARGCDGPLRMAMVAAGRRVGDAMRYMPAKGSPGSTEAIEEAAGWVATHAAALGELARRDAPDHDAARGCAVALLESADRLAELARRRHSYAPAMVAAAAKDAAARVLRTLGSGK